MRAFREDPFKEDVQWTGKKEKLSGKSLWLNLCLNLSCELSFVKGFWP